jgi:hypothetical protein
MRLKVISCNVFLREVSLLAARSSATLDISYVPQGLHNYPDVLRREIQSRIDEVDAGPHGREKLTAPPEPVAAIVLGFGLCSRALCGVASTRHRLVLPRVHDCIALLLGSHRRYRREFDANPGTYWFSPGWIEHSTFPCGRSGTLLRERFAEAYGRENADYLIEMEVASLQAYSRAALITWPGLDRPEYHDHAGRIAGEMEWQVEHLQGSPALMERILNGTWTTEDAVVAEPGQTFAIGDEDEVVKVVPCPE